MPTLSHLNRSTPVAMLAVTFLVIGLLAGLPAGAQLPSDSTAAGDAFALSQALFPDAADQVVIARADLPIDSLAGGFVQGDVAGPLVLTDPTELTQQAQQEIARLGATSATILGGTDAVSQAVEDTLTALNITVTRQGGTTRFGTAAAIAEAADTDTGILARAYPSKGNPTSVFADSIGGGTLGSGFAFPTFLTDSDSLTPATRQSLADSDVSTILVLGGVDAISLDVDAELTSAGYTVRRIDGSDRAVTAAAIAAYIEGNGPGVQRVILVDGYLDLGWASGFAAAGGNLDKDTVVLLSNGDQLPQATQDFLDGRDVDIICGPNTTPAACAAATGAAATGADPTDTPTNTPTDGPTDQPTPPDTFFEHVATFDVTTNGSIVAEIVDVTTDGQTLLYTDSENEELGLVDIADPTAPVPAGVIPLPGEPTSVGVLGDTALVAVNTSPDFDNPSGELVLVSTTDGTVLRSIDLGGQPDSVAIAPSGDYAAIAIENERDEDENNGLIPQPPAGSLVIVNTVGGVSDWTTSTVDMTGLAEIAPDDPEVEYVDINDADDAVVTLQENNHLAIVDLATGTVTADFSAGEVTVTGIDATEEEIGPQGNGDIQLTETITRRREPDAVTWVGDDTFATANEGDYEDADGVEGGSRGFTVFDTAGNVVDDSGNTFEYAQISAGHYNEARSENKGGEPEGVEAGTFGEDPLLFVGAERTNVVGVYDVAEDQPALTQLLPTGSGPEGLKAIPSRDLMVVAAENSVEDAFPAMVTIYQRGADRPDYPQVTSDAADAIPVPWVALSGLAGAPADDTVYAVSDSFLGVSYLYTIDAGSDPAVLRERLPLTGASFGLDAEGIAVAPEGGWWVASEGRTGDRPNAIVRVGSDGAVINEVELPAALADQATNSGFEGVAVTGATTSEFVYVVVQREWADDQEGVVKIGRYDVANATWGFIDYELDAAESPNGGWVGLSEITVLPDGTFAIIERDNQLGTDARIKRVYGVDLDAATFVPYGTARDTVPKTLLADVLAALTEHSIWTPDKLEGLAVTSTGRVVVVTDNDGLDDALGQTVWLDLGPVADALPDS